MASGGEHGSAGATPWTGACNVSSEQGCSNAGTEGLWSDWRELRAVMLGSACGGFLSRCLFHPIDTAKSMMQAQVTERHRLQSAPSLPGTKKPTALTASDLPLNGSWNTGTRGRAMRASTAEAQTKTAGDYRSPFASTWHTLRTVWNREGLPGLYRGFAICGFGSVPATCLYFTSFELLRASLVRVCRTQQDGNGGDLCTAEKVQDVEKRETGLLTKAPPVIDLAAGFGAEAISCIFWVPIDVCKERLQTQQVLGTSYYRGSWDGMCQIYRGEGLRQLYKGYGATLLSFGPMSALFFMFDNQLRARLGSTEVLQRETSASTESLPSPDQESALSPLASGGCALLAAAAAAWLTVPLDKVKLRLQIQRAQTEKTPRATPFLYRNVMHGLGEMYRTEGTRGIFRASGARVLFHSANFAVVMAVMEQVKSAYFTYVEPSRG